jgi:hypothetical protein
MWTRYQHRDEKSRYILALLYAATIRLFILFLVYLLIGTVNGYARFYFGIAVTVYMVLEAVSIYINLFDKDEFPSAGELLSGQPSKLIEKE